MSNQLAVAGTKFFIGAEELFQPNGKGHASIVGSEYGPGGVDIRMRTHGQMSGIKRCRMRIRFTRITQPAGAGRNENAKTFSAIFQKNSLQYFTIVAPLAA